MSTDEYPVCGFAMLAAERHALGNGDEQRGTVVMAERDVAEHRAGGSTFELAEALIWLGQAHRYASDDPALERAALDEAFAILAVLPRTTEWLRGYAVSGMIFWTIELGLTERARVLTEWMYELVTTTDLAEPDDTRWQEQHRSRVLEHRAQLATGSEAERLSRIALDEEIGKLAAAPRRGTLVVAIALRNLATICDANGKTLEAIGLLENAVAEVRHQYDDGEGMWFDAPYLAHLATLLAKVGRHQEATRRRTEAIDRFDRTAGYFRRTGDADTEKNFVTAADEIRREIES